MSAQICKACGIEYEIKDYKKYGILSIVIGILIFPVLWFISDTYYIPFVFFIILLSVGLYRMFRKDRYFYYCKCCGIKISK